MKWNRNRWVMYAIALLQGMVFYAPIATMYRQASDISVYEITVIECVCTVLSMLLELPWGYAADRIGYRKTMIFCCVLFFLSKLIFWQADSFPLFLLERILLAVVLAGMSGVDSTILYLSCAEEESQSVFGISCNLGQAGLIFAAVICSRIPQTHYRLTGLLTALSYGLSALCAWSLEEITPPAKTPLSLSSLWDDFSATLSACLKNTGLLLFVLADGLFGECARMVTTFFNQLQYQRAGLSSFGISLLYVVMTLCGLSAGLSARLTRKLGHRLTGILLILWGFIASLILAAADGPLLSVGAILTFAIADSLMGPLAMDLENRQITNPNRATALSVHSLLRSGVFVAIDLLLGQTAQKNLSTMFLLCAGLCGVALVLFLLSFRPAAA